MVLVKGMRGNGMNMDFQTFENPYPSEGSRDMDVDWIRLKTCIMYVPFL